MTETRNGGAAFLTDEVERGPRFFLGFLSSRTLPLSRKR